MAANTPPPASPDRQRAIDFLAHTGFGKPATVAAFAAVPDQGTWEQQVQAGLAQLNQGRERRAVKTMTADNPPFVMIPVAGGEYRRQPIRKELGGAYQDNYDRRYRRGETAPQQRRKLANAITRLQRLGGVAVEAERTAAKQGSVSQVGPMLRDMEARIARRQRMRVADNPGTNPWPLLAMAALLAYGYLEQQRGLPA